MKDGIDQDVLLMRRTILGDLPEEALLAALRQDGIRVMALAAGRLLHGEGEPCEALEVVLSGQLAVERIDSNGDIMRIAAFEAGDSIGGNLLFSSYPVYRLAVNVTQPAKIARVPKAALVFFLKTQEAFLLRYLRDTADNAGRLEGQLKDYANLSIRERLNNYLLAEQRRHGGRRIKLPGSKKALAAQLGVQRSSLSRVLQQLRQEGLLTFDRQSITLL